jgi:hypothetical protein
MVVIAAVALRSPGSRAVYRKGSEMFRKVLSPIAVLAAAWLVVSQRQDVVRYLKIRQMSMGGGHPGNVPAGGSQAYAPPGKGAADGTADFDSASRGGPALQ